MIKLKVKSKRAIFIFLVFCSPSLFSQSDLNGLWNTGKDNTVIEISESNGEIKGKIKSSDNEKAEIGKITLKELIKHGALWRGKIYAAKRKEWYDVEITPKNNLLKLKIDIGFMSKSLEWKKQ
ncbi:DUF2147 domain-containing protein [Lutimonas saemankumensis]|uniref:DUF2147 domain-containing protein n=1 Tax=Lutimonas saemankumensis TaxID=483016 RepID=UPI001CD1E0B9|nr:DUF2147 domain-containing protein [Lutimonas saemankumensis]MCA0931371.1 DUF2147 domain-containing protein [Lutimonas saemankumensis]